MAVFNLQAGNIHSIAANITQNNQVHVFFNTSGISGSITYTLGTATGRNAPRPISIPINNGGPHTIALGGQQLNIFNSTKNTVVQLLY
jgi:hypothetical protein